MYVCFPVYGFECQENTLRNIFSLSSPMSQKYADLSTFVQDKANYALLNLSGLATSKLNCRQHPIMRRGCMYVKFGPITRFFKFPYCFFGTPLSTSSFFYPPTVSTVHRGLEHGGRNFGLRGEPLFHNWRFRLHL